MGVEKKKKFNPPKVIRDNGIRGGPVESYQGPNLEVDEFRCTMPTSFAVIHRFFLEFVPFGIHSEAILRRKMLWLLPNVTICRSPTLMDG